MIALNFFKAFVVYADIDRLTDFFVCVLFVPMSECYHISVLNENALCLLMEILPGVEAEFWCVHTKRCKRLLGPMVCLVPQCFWQLFVQT